MTSPVRGRGVARVDPPAGRPRYAVLVIKTESTAPNVPELRRLRACHAVIHATRVTTRTAVGQRGSP